MACAALLLLAACAGSEAVQPPPPTVSDDESENEEAPADSLWMMTYQSWQQPQAWGSYNLSDFDTVFFSELEAAPDGSMDDGHGWPGEWQNLRTAARGLGVPLVPVVAVSSEATFAQLFSQPRARAVLRRNIVQMMKKGTTAGVQIGVRLPREADVPREARTGFARFARALRSDLDTYAAGAQLSFLLPAADASDVFNEQALAVLADFIVVQGDGPGPPSDWQAVRARYERQGVPLSKVVMAVSALEEPALSTSPENLASPENSVPPGQARAENLEAQRAFARSEGIAGLALVGLGHDAGSRVEGGFGGGRTEEERAARRSPAGTQER